MILAAALTLGGVLAALGLVIHCIAWCATHPPKRKRNRYRRDVLPPPSRHTLRKWSVAE